MRKRGRFRRWCTRFPPRGTTIANRRGRWEMEAEEASKAIVEKKRRKASGHTAQEKCRAVLSLWTERQKPAEICREMGVGWSLLSQWQERAMEGMLQALEPRVRLERGVALSPRLAVLLEKRSKLGATKGLEKRLRRLQEGPGGPVEVREAAGERKV
jgi:transposase-like protein